MADDRDAVCFTAGAPGAVFAAGVIHAHLAADRAAPAVIAGISAGSLSAAAMQRCYQDLAAARSKGTQTPTTVEAARWTWFRRYLTAVWDEPLRVIWDELPDQADFSADRLPIHDPAITDDVVGEIADKQPAALRNRYLLVKFGRWLAGLPVTVRAAASLLVAYVRWKERYPEPKGWRFVRLAILAIAMLVRLARYVAFNPSFFPEHRFPRSAVPDRPSRRRRPLLGWPLTLAAWALTSASAMFVVGAGALSIRWIPEGVRRVLLELFGWLPGRVYLHWTTDNLERWLPSGVPWFLAGAGAFVWVVAIVWLASLARARMYVLQQILLHLGLQDGLITDFHLQLRLARLFADPSGALPTVRFDPMPALLVTTALETDTSSDSARAPRRLPTYQQWFMPGAPLVTALRTTLALPGLFGPTILTPKQQLEWLGQTVLPDRSIHLVDGAVVRQNPLPALFYFLKTTQGEAARKVLEATIRGRESHPVIHVIYSVPNAPVTGSDGTLADEASNIVDVGLASMRLAQRRDTQLVVAQTNIVSRLQQEVLAASGAAAVESDTLPFFADEIAPTVDVAFDNPLRPTRKKVLETVAAGCRRTLETLYASAIRDMAGNGSSVPCATLLRQIAPQRPLSDADRDPDIPGLPEVCRACPRALTPPPHTQARSIAREVSLVADGALFTSWPPELTGVEPRIVFVASGGVFRGAFHIGLLGALVAADVRPNLVVGASVGTLMGGALAALFCADDHDRSGLLRDLVRTFEEVDSQVALTRRFKGAVRDLGVRARSVRLSPRQVQRMLARGSRHDPGFAAVGAPPPLIDAISALFMIPHRQTGDIAAEFVAGHVTEATHAFLSELRKETLVRLDIEYELMGSSLLTQAARKIFGKVDLKQRQPFLPGGRVAVFATATQLGRQAPILLGAESTHPGADYDFLEAALASSAFPCVFSPRLESNLYPGTGAIDVRFADGGMFDNLPFMPAIGILSRAQEEYRKRKARAGLTARDFLQHRHQRPDLIIAGALDANSKKATLAFDDPVTIATRAKRLQDNVKIRDFVWLAGNVYEQIGRLLRLTDGADAGPNESLDRLMDGVVDAGVLSIFPTDREHLNPTFAFSATMGLRREKIQISVADGCFQTFLTLATGDRGAEALRSALTGLADRVPKVRPRRDQAARDGDCPYFTVRGDRLACPFAKSGDTRPVYRRCKRDKSHIRLLADTP